MVETFRWLIHSVESILVVCRARADRLEREIEPDAHLHARIATCFRFVIGDLLSSAIHRHLSSIFFLSFVYKNIIYIYFFSSFFFFFWYFLSFIFFPLFFLFLFLSVSRGFWMFECDHGVEQLQQLRRIHLNPFRSHSSSFSSAESLPSEILGTESRCRRGSIQAPHSSRNYANKLLCCNATNASNLDLLASPITPLDSFASNNLC